jgi:hypothetical protein
LQNGDRIARVRIIRVQFWPERVGGLPRFVRKRFTAHRDLYAIAIRIRAEWCSISFALVLNS